MQTTKDVRFLRRTSPPHVVTLVLIAGISALSMNIFLPSLPNMAAYFQADYRLMQLSVSLYLGVNAVLQVFVGPISDRYGRRPVLLWGAALFVLATIGCLLASTVEVFLMFRMFQAVIVTGMVLSRAIVRDMVSQDEAASVIGYVTMGMAIVPMIGPAIGGVLDAAFGWQANFLLLAGLGVALYALIWADVGETAIGRATSFADQAREYPELLRSQRFWGYCAASAFSSGAFFAYLGGAPFVGSVVFGLDPEHLGLFFGAPAVGYMLGNFITGRYSRRVGINPMILWGTALSAFGLVLSILVFYAGHGSELSFFGFMTFVGLGNGLVIPNATSGMLSVRPSLAGTASGLGGAIMIGGGAVLSALAGATLSPETGAYPLLWIMLATAILGVASIFFVIRRERQIEVQEIG